MLRKLVLPIAFVLMAIPALPAGANTLTSATANANCQGFSNFTVNATGLTKNTTYTIDYTFACTSGGSNLTPGGSYTFKATSGTETVTVGSGTFSGTPSSSCPMTGSTATLTSSESTVPIVVNGGTALTCPSSPLTLACPASTGQVGVPYDSFLVASGGVPPYTYLGYSGGVPGVVTLNTTTGEITGTPTQAGTFNWQFQVTDSTGKVVLTGTQCSVTVAPSVPTQCVIPPSGTEIPGAPVSWNGFNAPAGSVVWINAHISGPGNVPTNTTTTVDFTGVSLVVNATTYALPNGQIVFSPNATTQTTAVNADGSWTTTVPVNQGGDIFFDGQAIPVDANMENGGGGNTGSTLSFTTNSSDSALQFNWQWGAAVYTSWPGNAAADIEPIQANGLQSGAPQNTSVQKDLIQGPRGGGGSNFTGSWSGTGHGTCP